jgi:hypothetical protein
MNTSDQKAQELVDKFMQPVDELHKYPMCFDTAKQCAIICCEEIMEVLGELNYGENGGKTDTYGVNEWRNVIEKIKQL